ncbi:DUF3597 domain-containing protein [Phenylobacterium sp. J426]|uniref:DUF3597 domain-containing protein n=1 Tax=Phenylobacterium sp. J426 TaxID=2898439 RepID=UPI0021516E94|nr:DUF3597 domain-containing protein [Phenylobacterium sp. J426]MCR5872921.1 DUF3597 domain-containing protein [Phenylobacterium sp. J426]
MGIFSAIKDKIFGHKRAAPGQAQAPAAQAPAAVGASTPAAATSSASEPAVDVEAVLASMAEMQDGGGGNWRTSIVDLLKLLHMDSSLQARKELADELGVRAGEHGSAEQNIALHKAVMKKLAENGGQVPSSFYT